MSRQRLAQSGTTRSLSNQTDNPQRGRIPHLSSRMEPTPAGACGASKSMDMAPISRYMQKASTSSTPSLLKLGIMIPSRRKSLLKLGIMIPSRTTTIKSTIIMNGRMSSSQGGPVSTSSSTSPVTSISTSSAMIQNPTLRNPRQLQGIIIESSLSSSTDACFALHILALFKVLMTWRTKHTHM